MYRRRPKNIFAVMEEDTRPARIADVEMSAAIVAALPRLRRFARTLCRNAHDADDLVQLAVERALRNVAQYRPDANPLHWLFGIVRHAWFDEVRARQRRRRIFAPAESGEDAPAADSTLEGIALQRALATLPDEQRLAVGLVLVEGLSYKEAADVLDVPIGTLTSRLARARTALAAQLDPAVTEGR
ncbi:MAG TPA: sigma-70 family RNA polymerase sigma factor [Steroidobacteraceae bacterium]|nr:sigma-70 family RNA polymerase sigma factor [Steroidobacteraceae bacterium]